MQLNFKQAYYTVNVFQTHVEIPYILQTSLEQLNAFNFVLQQEQFLMKETVISMPLNFRTSYVLFMARRRTL
jgi:hypothetical protein